MSQTSLRREVQIRKINVIMSGLKTATDQANKCYKGTEKKAGDQAHKCYKEWPEDCYRSYR
jgi:hypothetical protein